MLAYLFYSFGPNAILSFLVWLIVVAIIVAVAIWAVRYIGLPDIIVKLIVVLAILFALGVLLDVVGVFGGGTVIIHDAPRVR